MAAFLSLPRVVQLLVCSYCDTVRESAERPMHVTLYSDGFQVTLCLYGAHYFEFLPNWSPVEVRFHKADGVMVLMQNEKMHAHNPIDAEETGVLSKRSLVPVMHDPTRFEYQNVDMWYIAPCAPRHSFFPVYIVDVLRYTVIMNALREFV